MSRFSGASSWRISFLLLNVEEQTQRVRALGKAGWSNIRIATLTGWSLNDIRHALDANTAYES